MPKTEHIGLTSRQVQNFIDDGFVKVENAFSTDLAKQCSEELWVDIGLSPDKPDNWIQPVKDEDFTPPSLKPQTRRAYTEPTMNSPVMAAGLCRKPSEHFRSASPRRNSLLTLAGMWTRALATTIPISWSGASM